MRAAFQGLIAVLMMGVAGAGQAACPRPGAPPAMPNGATATKEAMSAGHDQVQAYVNLLQDYRACLQEQAKDLAETTPVQLRATWIAQGDAALDYAETLASQYSTALKIFKERPPTP